MLAKQRDSKPFPQSYRVLIIHTRYAESGGECSVVKNEVDLLKANGYEIKELYFDNHRFAALKAMFMFFNMFSFIRVVYCSLKFRPSLAHIHNTHFAASHSIIWALKVLNIPIVKTLHNYRLLCPSATLFFNGKLYLKSLNTSFPWGAIGEKVYRNSLLFTFWLAFGNWLHRKVGTWRLVDKFFVFSEQGQQLMLQSNLKIKSSQLSIKPNFATKNLSPAVRRGNQFLFIGRLSEEKGIKVLLDAFLLNGLPLTIIGDGPCSIEVENAIQKNPLIQWKGYQSKEIINKELKECTALVFPSVCYEGMPVSMIEAFASSTPIIASKIGVMENMVEHNYSGLLFEAGNAEDLSKKLLDWDGLSNIRKNEFCKRAQREYEKKYTPYANLSNLLSVYNAVIANRRVYLRRTSRYKSNSQIRKLAGNRFQKN